MKKDKKLQITRSRLEKDFEEFVYLLPKLQPIEIYGLAKIFSIALYEDDKKTPRDFGEVLEGMMDKFENLQKRRRKEILEIMREITKGGRR